MVFSLMLLLPAALQATLSQRQLYCAASTQGERHSRVNVQFYLEDKKHIIGHGIRWTPPIVRKKVFEPSASDIDLGFGFDNAVKGQMKSPTDASVSESFDISIPIKGVYATLSIDGKQIGKADLSISKYSDPDMLFIDGNFDLSSSKLMLVASSGKVELRIFSSAHHLLSEMTYSTAQVQMRTHLFRQAWNNAWSKVQSPSSCG